MSASNLRPGKSGTSRLAAMWYRCWHRICTWLYFGEVRVLGPERHVEEGPVLYIALHRNGAVDGFIYHCVVPAAEFLISKQLRRNLLGKLFFGGIEVARRKDGEDAAGNEAALAECVDLLERGGHLIVFPEGTSSLGPRHLPFKSGAARIAMEALRRGVPLTIVPLGIHYQRAWAFRSGVEVVVGESVFTAMDESPGDFAKRRELKKRMARALEEVGVNFGSERDQETAECLARARVREHGSGFFRTLKTLEQGIPRSLVERLDELPSGAWRFHEVPVFADGGPLLPLVRLGFMGPLVLAGAILNLPPLLVAWVAGKCFADGMNVIALWRMMTGVPVGIVWSASMIGLCAWMGGIGWVAAYVVLTGALLEFLPRIGPLLVSVRNGVVHRKAGGQVGKFRDELNKCLPVR